MKARFAFALFGMAFALASCDAQYESRMAVETKPSRATTDKVVASVREYAAANHLACTPMPGTLVHCHRPPILVFARFSGYVFEVCYLATGSPLEASKFTAHIGQLEAELASRFGRASVARSSRRESQCQLSGGALLPLGPGWPDLSKREELDRSDQAAVSAIVSALETHADVVEAYFVKIPKAGGGHQFVLIPVFDGEASDGALGDATSAFAKATSGQRLDLLLLTPEVLTHELASAKPIYSRL